MERQKSLTLLALAITLAGTLIRILPHADNFAPVAAVALFAGATLPTALALTVPLIVVIASDLVLGPHDLAFFTWGSFLLAGFIGVWVRKNPGIRRIAAGSLAASVSFFLITNFGVFLFGRLYPLTWKGLVDCYVMAVPFFRNTLVSDLVFTGVFFGLYALAKKTSPAWTNKPKESF